MQRVRFGLVDPVDEIKGCIALAGLFPAQGEFLRSLLYVLVAEDKAVEAVDGLALIFGRLELCRVETKSIVRAAGRPLVGSVQQRARASPAAIYQCLVEVGT